MAAYRPYWICVTYFTIRPELKELLDTNTAYQLKFISLLDVSIPMNLQPVLFTTEINLDPTHAIGYPFLIIFFF